MVLKNNVLILIVGLMIAVSMTGCTIYLPDDLDLDFEPAIPLNVLEFIDDDLFDFDFELILSESTNKVLREGNTITILGDYIYKKGWISTDGESWQEIIFEGSLKDNFNWIEKQAKYTLQEGITSLELMFFSCETQLGELYCNNNKWQVYSTKDNEEQMYVLSNPNDDSQKICNGRGDRSCSVPNGEGQITRDCINGKWSSWGDCQAISCNEGYILESGACIQETSEPEDPVDPDPEEPGCDGANTQSCQVPNGEGEQTRTCTNGEWSSWGECQAISCNPGYILQNGICIIQEDAGNQANFMDAYAMNQELGRGIYIGQSLESPCYGEPEGVLCEGNWGVTIQEEYMDIIKQAGFDTVYIPIGWHRYTETTAPYTIHPVIFDRVDEVIEWAFQRGLNVQINIHHYNELMTSPNEEKDRFLAIWHQIANHYKNYPENLVFKVLDEPRSQLDNADIWNPLLAEAIETIRITNPRRILLASPGGYGNWWLLSDFELPTQDTQLIASFHYFQPHSFTHQTSSQDITWGTDSQKETANTHFNTVAQWGINNNRPINLGGYGANRNCDLESRRTWVEHILNLADSKQFSWGFWDFASGGYGAYQRTDNYWRDFAVGILTTDTNFCEGDSIRTCPITNGEGEQTRTCTNGEWSLWGECQVKSCNPGYILENNACVIVDTDEEYPYSLKNIKWTDIYTQDVYNYYDTVFNNANDYTNKVYIDPQYTGTSTGSITQPFKSLTEVNRGLSNTAYLIKRGTTQDLSSHSGYLSFSGNNIMMGAYGQGDMPKVIGVTIEIRGSDTLIRDLHLRTVRYGRTPSSPNANNGKIFNTRFSGGSELAFFGVNYQVIGVEIFDKSRNGMHFIGHDPDTNSHIEIGYSHIHTINQVWHPDGEPQSVASGDAIQVRNFRGTYHIHNNILDKSDNGNKALIFFNPHLYTAHVEGIVENNYGFAGFSYPDGSSGFIFKRIADHNEETHHHVTIRNNVLIGHNYFTDGKDHWSDRGFGGSQSRFTIYGNILVDFKAPIFTGDGSSGKSIVHSNTIYYTKGSAAIIYNVGGEPTEYNNTIIS